MINQVFLDMIEYFGNDAKRINHAIKVYGFAKAIAEAEHIPSGKKLLLEYAAILHDIGIKNAEEKYHSSAGRYQELEGPPVAMKILKKIGLDEADIDRICFLIGNHHSYAKIDGLDFRILVEADFLVNIFEDNLTSKQIQDIKKNYFETETGKKLISSIYNV